ncbi:MAG: GFA family protein [Hyphomonadaceae bacterium]|nr:GFA family protein [Hyphomonadaceae bacterium]
MTDQIHGRCLCGGVAYTLARNGTLSACHCRMCQRWTGSVFIDMMVDEGEVSFQSQETLVWFESSDWARRGFCGRCGSSLFYRLKTEGAHWAVLVGTLDLPEGFSIGEEIFIDEKPDYYDLAGDRPRLTGAEVFARFNESQS